MELRVLHYFLTVAREGNFSRAAEKLHLSQPTLSRQIKDMEDEYGKMLLIREPRRVLLTEDGELLRRRAEEILSLVEKTEGELLSNDRSISGDIRIGAGESVNFRLVMQVAKEIRNTYPDIRFHIISGDGETTLHRLDRGLIDFGYVYGDLDPAKYHQLSLPARDRWVVLMNNQDELAQKETIASADLHNRPLLLSRQTLSPSTHGDELLDWLGKPLEELHIAGSYTLLYNASLMAREGLGCALAFENIINTKGSDICYRPLKPEIFAQPFIAWKKNQVFSKASQKFLEALKNSFL
ncbi:LysR family transcriptional regulator [Selenomonas ruminis]|uniref:LysR family transcriptional regulator n=1 Tax=Selenomonas ruminis TaxID=2593411 RepID=A0A5D6W9Y6_9FIRM|nr:LysR family transcriptional regulator [Selenomonas sp. mPRGC5]TYZ25113.1 LysR family transcriptional regulator [Selenomonas sp. mPRGC5]